MKKISKAVASSVHLDLAAVTGGVGDEPWEQDPTFIDQPKGDPSKHRSGLGGGTRFNEENAPRKPDLTTAPQPKQ